MKIMRPAWVGVLLAVIGSSSLATAAEPAGEATTAADASHWVADAHGCKAYNDGSADSITWSGACEGGYISGPGTLVKTHGAASVTVKGTWISGRLDERSRATLSNSSGMHYEGTLHNNVPQGSGELTYPDGSKYTGEFQNGAPNGSGTLLEANGTKYVGPFRNGAPNGSGVMSQGEQSATVTFENGQLVSRGPVQNTGGAQAQQLGRTTANAANSVDNASSQHNSEGDVWLSCRITLHTVDKDPSTGQPGSSTSSNLGPWLFIVNTKAKYILLYDSRNRAATRMDTPDPAAGGYFLVGLDAAPEDDVRMESNTTTLDDEHIVLRRVASHKSRFEQGRPTTAKSLTIGRTDLAMAIREESYSDANALLAVETNRGLCEKASAAQVDSWPAVGRQF